MDEHILVIGATLIDSKGKPLAGMEPHTSNPAQLRVTRGGTARNVAENLGLLGADVSLITAIGDDLIGHHLMEQTAAANVNIQHVQVIRGESTGAYLAIIDEDGSLAVALDDVSVMHHITPGLLYRKRRLFRDADMVMMDGSLDPEAIEMVVKLCREYKVPLAADPSSARLAYKLRPYLPDIHLIVPNENESIELCQVGFIGEDPDISLDLARSLVQRGVTIAVLTLADFGLAYATSQEVGYVPPRYSQIVDTTGTGDSVTAAIMFAYLNDLEVIEAIRLGAAAASLTLQTAETVVPGLSLDMLYEHLII